MLVLVAALSFQIAADLAHGVTQFGTSRAPYSDALGPWLHGALNYLFYGEPRNYLYRPTIGIYFGSIIAASGRIDAIPIFFVVSLAAFLLFAIPKADQDLQVAFLFWLLFGVFSYTVALQPLNFENLMPDVPAFVFTLIGFYLVFVAIRTRQTDGRLLWVGFLAIGIAAAIRGPMMLAGAAMLPFIYGITEREARSRLLIPAVMLFLLPIFIDIAVQRLYGVMNNGIVTMFCFYTEPSYSWTTPCQQHYLDLQPNIGIVLVHYLQTLLSKEGFSVVIGNLGARISSDGLRFYTTGFRGVFAVLALCLFWSVVRNPDREHTNVTGIARLLATLKNRHFTLTRIILVAVAGLMVYRWGPLVLVITLSGMVALISVVMRLHRPLLGLVAYWFGAIFLALMTQAHEDRLGLTFSFMLYLAVFLCICDRPRVQESEFNPRIARWFAIAIIAAGLFLYLGVFLIPNEWKAIYQSQVEGRSAALKISEDRGLDRCLYFTGRRDLVYMKCDNESIGSVRQYSRIEAPAGLWSESYRLPARFVP